ncbi:hypothetical protein QQS21_008205 [Conoideocrella luteorostrata]|uniref:Major facilitator superfamily (MFS) profile domain-containing protein n=1 Tax=Conoideocrella luteorostrata TaxID=1105319 RepID=A0AAJ0FRN5_9HYPO|nr:hypothetical protein QQS21_008205 [Conoideocrella luteorostrata]
MPSIVEDLGSNYAYVWIANAYFLTTTALQPLYGQTANIMGRRFLILSAVFLFAAGSAISGAAPSLGVLITGRAIQGIGGGGINVLVNIIVADLVPLRERPRYVGIIFIFSTIPVVLGPVFGGLLAERISWRWIFYINLPISAVAWAMLALFLKVKHVKDSARNSLKRVDLGGNALLVASVTSVLLALTWGGVEFPWSSWRTLLPLILGLAGLGAFAAVESTTMILEPTMPPRLFSNRTSAGGFAIAMLHSMLMYSLTYFLPVYFQGVLGTGVINSGVNLLPLASSAMPFAILAAIGVSKFGRYRPWFFVGAVFYSVCFGSFTLLDRNSSTAFWAGMQCIGGAAAGVLTTTTLPSIQAPLAEADQAVATAIWAFVRSFGAIWGVAIPAAVFNSRINELVASIDDVRIQTLLSNGGAYAMASIGGLTASQDWSPEVIDQVRVIYVDSLRRCWEVGIALSLLIFLLSFLVKEVSLRTELETNFGMEDNKRPAKQKQVNGLSLEAAQVQRVPLKGLPQTTQQEKSTISQVLPPN